MSKAPERIPEDALRVRMETADGKFRLGIAVEAASHDSVMAFGVATVPSGTERVSWKAADGTHEAYYVTTGSLKVGWSGPDSGESVLGAQDCFYFPPGRTYTLENVGDDEAFFVWTLSPSPVPSPEWR